MTEIVIACTVLLALVALGDVISCWTKALIPSMAAAMIIYMLLTWVGMPKSFPETSGFAALGDYALLILCAHLGTIVKPSEYVKNWKMIILALVAVICGLIFTVGIGGLIFGFDKMLAGAGACCGGGCVSGLAAINKLDSLGLTSLIVVPTLMICAVDPLGQPIASFFVKKYVLKLNKSEAFELEKESRRRAAAEVRLTKHGVPFGSEDNPSTRITNFIPKKFEEDGFLLFELAAIVLICQVLQNVTGLDATFFAFFIAIIGCATGVLRMNVLDRSHSYGLILTILIGYLCSTMNDVTPSLFISNIAIILALIILSALGLGIGGAVAGKFLGYDVILSAAAGIAIMFQNPGINVIIDEVSRRYSRNEEEEKFINNKIAPPLLIAVNIGFAFGLGITVTLLLPLLAKF